jgi:hypothetical protein
MFGELSSRDVVGSIRILICLECLRELTKNLMGVAICTGYGVNCGIYWI